MDKENPKLRMKNKLSPKDKIEDLDERLNYL